MSTERGAPPRTLSAGPGGDTRDLAALQKARRSRSGFVGSEPPESSPERRGGAHQGFARSRARELAPDRARAPGNAGTASSDLQQLTFEGLWPQYPDPGRRVASKGRKPREGAASEEKAAGARRTGSSLRGCQSCSQPCGDPTFASRFSPGSARLRIAGPVRAAGGSCAFRSLPGWSLVPSLGGAG